jgi:hypothetical protein
MSIVLVGSTSGSVTLQEPAVAGTTVLDLPAVSGTVLTTGSSGQSIPKAALPTGSVLQVVNATYSTSTDTSGNTFIDTGLSASITPTSSSSKILVFVSQTALVKFGGTSNGSYMALRLLRNSTSLITFEPQILYTGSTLEQNSASSTTYLDSPATTSSTTYKTQFRNAGISGTVRICADSGTATITLMEIAA